MTRAVRIAADPEQPLCSADGVHCQLRSPADPQGPLHRDVEVGLAQESRSAEIAATPPCLVCG